MEDRLIKLTQLAKYCKISAKLRFGEPEELLEMLGLLPGSVTPAGLINDFDSKIDVILDKQLFDHDIINFHPLTNDKTTSIKSADFKLFVEKLGNFCQIVDFDLINSSSSNNINSNTSQQQQQQSKQLKKQNKQQNQQKK